MQLVKFHQPGIFNYSALLLSEDNDTLYVGAREAVFAVNALNIAQKQHEVWPGFQLPCGLGCRPLLQCFLLKSAHAAPPQSSGASLATFSLWQASDVLFKEQPPLHSLGQGPLIWQLSSCTVSMPPQSQMSLAALSIDHPPSFQLECLQLLLRTSSRVHRSGGSDALDPLPIVTPVDGGKPLVLYPVPCPPTHLHALLPLLGEAKTQIHSLHLLNVSLGIS